MGFFFAQINKNQWCIHKIFVYLESSWKENVKGSFLYGQECYKIL